jgi:hypothetical protein
LGGKWLAVVGKTPKGKKPQGRQLSKQISGSVRQRQQSGHTLERSERLREENPRKSNSMDPRKSETLRDRAARSKIIEGAKNQQRSLALLRQKL